MPRAWRPPASTVGTLKILQSFNVFLFNTASGYSQINATATGGIYMQLTAAELIVLNSTEWALSPWTSSGASSGASIDMRMQNIVASSGDVVIDLPQAVRAYQLATPIRSVSRFRARSNTLRRV
jgi:hypothetical protein